MTEEIVDKPLPSPSGFAEPFWEAGAEGRLLLIRCKSCDESRVPSSEVCPNCLSVDFEWYEASGLGVIYTYGIMHRLYHPAFEQDLPYNLVVVELQEGPHLPGNIIGIENDALRVGMPVQVVWQKYSDISIPRFQART